jgi:hypothetical protein
MHFDVLHGRNTEKKCRDIFKVGDGTLKRNAKKSQKVDDGTLKRNAKTSLRSTMEH